MLTATNTRGATTVVCSAACARAASFQTTGDPATLSPGGVGFYEHTQRLPEAETICQHCYWCGSLVSAPNPGACLLHEKRCPMVRHTGTLMAHRIVVSLRSRGLELTEHGWERLPQLMGDSVAEHGYVDGLEVYEELLVDVPGTLTREPRSEQ